MRCRLLTLPALLLTPALVPAQAPSAASAVSIARGDENTVEFKDGSGVAARYVAGPKVAKPYLWPVHAPNGVPVTRGWPMLTGQPGETTDHVHQKSAWFCHGDVIPEGLELKVKTADKHGRGVDFWSEAKDKDGSPRHGRIVCVSVAEPRQAGPTHASVETRNEWRSADGVKIMDEVRTIHFRTLPEGRLWVFDIDLHASAYPITFGDTKEGSFGVRVNDAIRLANKDGGGAVVASDGTGSKAPAKDNLPVWGQVSEWNDYSGSVDGKAAGVAVFADPKNPSPSAWHTRAYGLMAANPFGRGQSFPSQKGKTDLVKIEKGGHLKLRFGIYAHNGDATSGKVASAFEAFKAGK